MANDKLIQANRDSSVWIKEKDASYVHVRLHRYTVLPNDPLHPIHNSWIQIYDTLTWSKMQQMKQAKISVDWLKASLVNSFEVVHLPVSTNNVKSK